MLLELRFHYLLHELLHDLRNHVSLSTLLKCHLFKESLFYLYKDSFLVMTSLFSTFFFIALTITT